MILTLYQLNPPYAKEEVFACFISQDQDRQNSWYVKIIMANRNHFLLSLSSFATNFAKATLVKEGYGGLSFIGLPLPHFAYNMTLY